MLCAAGTYKTSTGCDPCPPGTYNSYDGGKCRPCPEGTYNPSSGQVDCFEAPAGGYTDSLTGSTTFTYCPPGTYQEAVGFGNAYFESTACNACPPKTYGTGEGQTACFSVPFGWYTNRYTGATGIAPCPVNYFNPDVGFGLSYTDPTACTPCLDGYYTTEVASKNCTSSDSNALQSGFNQGQVEEEVNTANTLATTAIALAATATAVAATVGIVSCMSSCFPDLGTWLMDHILGWLEGKAEDVGTRAARNALHHGAEHARPGTEQIHGNNLNNSPQPERPHERLLENHPENHNAFVFVDNSMATLAPHPIIHQPISSPLLIQAVQAPVLVHTQLTHADPASLLVEVVCTDTIGGRCLIEAPPLP